MASTGSAFVKGGCGCVVAFLVVGLVAVMLGGSMHIDLGGAIMLFVIGGVIGLVALAIYNSGYAKGREPPPPPQDDDYQPQ
jgi:hypothetical protein